MELKLLGTTEVSVCGQRPPLGGPRARAVLVDLALHARRSVSIAQLIDDMWGESPPASDPTPLPPTCPDFGACSTSRARRRSS